MKYIHYINPTAKMPLGMQRRLALPYEPDQEYISGQDDALSRCLRQMRGGRALLVVEFSLLSRRTEDLCRIVRQVFDNDACLANVYGALIKPQCGDEFIQGMMATKRYLASTDAKGMARQAANRISDEERERVLKYWLDHDLTVQQIEKFSGYSYSAMRNWFKDQHPRPERRGRRPGSKNKPKDVK